MPSTTASLAEVTAFARVMRPDLPAVDRTLAAVRSLFAAAAVPYVLVGGAAVVHHGYVRATVDLDLLVDDASQPDLEPHLAQHGFRRESRRRLRHLETGVAVDLLLGGESMPRPGAPPYPRPQEVERSSREADVASLAALLALKLAAGRHQDRADVVALLQPLAEDEYLAVEAALPVSLRRALLELRRDALEEESWRQE